MEALEQDKLGARSIDSIKPSDAKEWAVRMKENGFSYKTINNYKRSPESVIPHGNRGRLCKEEPF